MLKMICPIGLICEHFVCDKEYCRNLAKPWPLPVDPFFLSTKWQSIIPGFKVTMPEYETYDDVQAEYEIEQIDRYNHWVQSVHHGFWSGGWWKAVDLPYEEVDKDGGLIVTQYLPIDEDSAFTCCLYYGHDGVRRYIPCWESFLPPVPINGYQLLYHETPPLLTDEDFEDACETDNSVILKNGFELLFSYHFERNKWLSAPLS